MTSQDNTDLADFSLVRWRRGSEGDFTGGLVHAGQLWSLAGVPDIEGDILRACLAAQEDGGVHGLLERVSKHHPTGPLRVEDVELGPPVSNPDKILCLGLNYTDHASGAGFEAPTVPIIFSKFSNCLVRLKGAAEGVDHDLETLTEVWIATNNEDRSFVEKAQRGASDPGYVPGPYGTVEDDVEAFVNWYIQRLSSHFGSGRDHLDLVSQAAGQ